MKLIIGLGNPGKEYIDTRHNVGFILLDKIQEVWNFSKFKFNKKFNSEISKKWEMGKGKGEILLVKPQTFMNRSGEAVQTILDFYKLEPKDIIVIHDDLDIELGKYKIAVDSSSAGHKGVQNIIDQLGTQKFTRIRIGISKNPAEKTVCQINFHDYVLQKFSQEELEIIKKIFGDVSEEIKTFIA